MNDYPPDWPLHAALCKEAAGGRCEHCGTPHGPPPAILTTHHLAPDKANVDPWNLVALCQRCHLHFATVPLLVQGWFWGPPEWLRWRLQCFANVWAQEGFPKEISCGDIALQTA